MAGIPPKPQMVAMSQISVAGFAVLFKHPIRKLGGRAFTRFIQGGKRAPTFMRVVEDGPDEQQYKLSFQRTRRDPLPSI